MFARLRQCCWWRWRLGRALHCRQLRPFWQERREQHAGVCTTLIGSDMGMSRRFQEAFTRSQPALLTALWPVNQLALQHGHNPLPAVRVQRCRRPWRKVEHQINRIEERWRIADLHCRPVYYLRARRQFLTQRRTSVEDEREQCDESCYLHPASHSDILL